MQWLLVVAAIVGVGVVVAWYIGGRPNKEARPPARNPTSESPPGAATPAEPREAFGYKSQWLAVLGTSSQRIAQLLELEDVREVAWNEGVQAAYEQSHVFITEPIDGWILALDASFVGFAGGDILDDPERLARWSRETGSEILLFFCDRRSESYGWLKARSGQLERAHFRVEGERNLDVGEQTADEAAVLEAVKTDPRDDGTVLSEGEDLVFRMAEKWSVDPHTLDARDGLPAAGLLGRIPE